MPILLWLLGIPIPIIILLVLLSRLKKRTSTKHLEDSWALDVEFFCGYWAFHCPSSSYSRYFCGDIRTQNVRLRATGDSDCDRADES